MKFIDGDFFEGLADFSFGDMYTNPINPSVKILRDVKGLILNEIPVFFIETHRIFSLISCVEQVDFDVIIITHNSDFGIPDTIKSFPPNIKKIFSQNYIGNHPIIDPIPIGLERTLWFPERNKQAKIRKILENVPNKKDLLYCNFDLNTNPIRKEWYESINKHLDIDMGNNLSDGFDSYIQNLSNAKFTISPPGNGADCHRNWESLYVQSVPVIADNLFNRSVFYDLPCVFIERKNINNIYDILIDRKDEVYDFSSPKLGAEYWKTQLENEKNN